MRNHPLEEIKSTSPDNSDTCFVKQNCCQRNPQNMNKIYLIRLYFSGCMCKICEKYPYNCGVSKGAFL